MNSSKSISRIYGGGDAEMIQNSKTMLGSFTEDLAVFTGYDPDFNEAYAQEWQAEIDAAENIQKENSVADILTGLTKKVNDGMAECQKKFQLTKHFIEKAFPGNKAVQNEFGYNDYSGARQSQPKMIQFMRNFDKAANKYSEQLIAANYTAENITEIKTIGDNLDAANTEQESYKKNRPVLSQDRITALNMCWQKCAKVGETGKLLFAGNAAKYSKYLLYEKQSAPQPETPADGGNA